MEFNSIRNQPLNLSGFSNLPKEKKVEKGEDGDELKKGHFSEIFGYSSDVKVEKKGKDIKQALEALVPKERGQKEEYYDKMKSELEACEHQPTEEPSNYMFDGLKHKLDVVPKMFSYDMIRKYNDAQESGVSGAMTVEEEVPEGHEGDNHYEEYNEYAREYIKQCVDLVKMNTMIDNINESKKYELTVQQAAMLGF